MAIQNINVGTEPNDGTGDPIRDSLAKANANFQELDARATAAQSGATAASEAAAASLQPDAVGVSVAALEDGKVPDAQLPASALRESTDDLPEGESNQYFTQPRVITALTDNAEDARAALGVYSEGQTIPVYPAGDVPESSVGPVVVESTGLMEWNGTKYVPRHPPIYPSNAIPAADVDPIVVIGIGLMEWNGTGYVPAATRGVTDGTNAPAGFVGEFMTLEPVATNTGNNIVWNHGALTLTPGDWDIAAGCAWFGNGISITNYWVSIADTGTSLHDATWRIASMALPSGVSAGIRLHIPRARFNITSTRIFYLNTQWLGSGAGTVTAGPYMNARRIR